MRTVEEAIIANTNLTHQEFVDYPLVVNGTYDSSAWPPSGFGTAPTLAQVQAWQAA